MSAEFNAANRRWDDPRAVASSASAICIAGGKGGVGKSHIALNVALALGKMKYRVMLLDGDFGNANIHVMIGMEPLHTLNDVVLGHCEFNDVIVQGPHGVQFIHSASGYHDLFSLPTLGQMGLVSAFNGLSEDIDYLIVDTASGINQSSLNFCCACHEIILVLNNEPTSIVDTAALINILFGRYQLRRFRVLVNMGNSANDGREVFNRLMEVTADIGPVFIDYLGYLPFDRGVSLAAREQVALMDYAPESRVIKRLEQVAKRVSEWPARKESSGVTEFFVENNLSQQESR